MIGDDCVYIGASGLDADGAPIALAGWAKPYRIDADGTIELVKPIATASRKPRSSVKLSSWDVADGSPYANGTSPRYASLAGPEDLPSCGASTGYGWYGMTVKSSSAKTVQLLSPGLGGRVHFYVDGAPQMIFGPGPDGTGGPIALKLKKGEQTIVTLIDNYGRPCEGHDIDIPIGFRDHLFEVKAMTAKPAWVEDNPIDPFSLRAFIYGTGSGAGSDPMMVEWSFKHLKKSPVFLHFEEVATPCTVVLNGEPIAFHAGETGLTRRTVLLDPEHEHFKRGVNTLRLAPLPGLADALKAELKQITLFQATPFSADARWTFAKWEPPAAGRFESVSATAASAHKGRPTWWRTSVDVAPSERHDLARRFTTIIADNHVASAKHLQEIAGLERPLSGSKSSPGARDSSWAADRWIQFPQMNSDWRELGLFNNYAGVAHDLADAFKEKRLTQCAIAIKRFVKRYDRFPDSLSQLTENGLPAEVLNDRGVALFRYEPIQARLCAIVASGFSATGLEPEPAASGILEPNGGDKIAFRQLPAEVRSGDSPWPRDGHRRPIGNEGRVRHA